MDDSVMADSLTNHDFKFTSHMMSSTQIPINCWPSKRYWNWCVLNISRGSMYQWNRYKIRRVDRAKVILLP